MKKLFKIILGLLVVILVACVGLFFFANSILEKFRPQLVQIISDNLHHQVELGGIEVKFFPEVGIAISDIVLPENAPSEKETNKLGSLILETSLSQIFTGNISVSSLVIKDLQLNLKRSKDGVILAGNLPLIGPKSSTESLPQQSTDHKSQTDSQKESSLAFNLNNAKLQNLSLTWTDESTKPAQHFSLSNLDADISAEASGGDFQVNLNVQGQPSEIIFNDLFKKPQGEPFSISANILKAANGSIAGKTFKVTLGKISLDLPFNTNMEKIEAQLLPTSNIDLTELEKFLPLAKEFALKGNLLPDLKAQVALNSNQKVPIKLNGTIELKNLNANYTPQNKEPIVVGPINGKLNFDNDTLTAKPLNIIFAGQTLELTSKISHLDQPIVAFVLKSEKLELDPILKSLGSLSPGLAGSSLTVVSSTGTFSTANKSGTINFSLGKSKIGKNELTSLQFSADITPEKILIKPSSVQAFAGDLKTQGEVAINSDKSQLFSISLNGAGFDLEAITNVAAPDSKISLAGILSNLSAKATADAKQLLPTLSSTTEAIVSNGAIKGINIVGSALNKVSGIPGLESSLASYIPAEYQNVLNGDSTAFDKLALSANLNKQTIDLQNLSLEHALYIIRGNGELTLNADFTIKAKLLLTPLISKGMIAKQPKLKLIVDENNNLVFPVVISRKNGSNLVVPDVSQLLERAAKNTAKEAAGRALEKVAPGLGGASKLLDKLF